MFPTISSFANFAFNKVYNSIKHLKIGEALDWVNWSAIELTLFKSHYESLARNYFNNKEYLK